MYRYTAERFIHQPPEVVISYLADPAGQVEWVHGCSDSHWVAGGPAEGAVAEQTMTFMGKRRVMTMTMTEYAAGRRVSFEKDRPFPIRFGFEAEAEGDGTRLRYPVEMKPRGPMRLAIALVGRRVNRGDLDRIASRLDGRTVQT